jgi:hypothetical protein
LKTFWLVIVRATHFNLSTYKVCDVDYARRSPYLSAIPTNPNTAIIPVSLRNAALGAYNALQNAIVAKATDQRNTEGLSIYFPGKGETIDRSYLTRNQNFLRVTGWSNFLNAFVNRTTRRSNLFAEDWAESNEVAARAYNFNTLIGNGHVFTDLSLHQASDLDWFRFTMGATGIAGDKIAIAYNNAAGQRMSFLLYDRAPNGQRRLRRSSGAGSIVSLAGLGRGEYFIQVRGNGVIVPEYSLAIDAPGTVTNGNDWARGNNRSLKANELGIITTETQLAGLRVDSTNPDWFKFETPKNQIVKPGRVTVSVNGNQTLSGT